MFSALALAGCGGGDAGGGNPGGGGSGTAALTWDGPTINADTPPTPLAMGPIGEMYSGEKTGRVSRRGTW